MNSLQHAADHNGRAVARSKGDGFPTLREPARGDRNVHRPTRINLPYAHGGAPVPPYWPGIPRRRSRAALVRYRPMDTLPQLRSHADVPSFTQASDGVAFGQFLRRARERRGLTLRQIADETKIPERHLNALEQGNLSAVPRGIYQRAEVRAFAKMVGLDQDLALAEFARAVESSDEEAGSTSLVDEETRPRALAIIGVMTLSIAAASMLAMWAQWLPSQSGRPVLAATYVTPDTALEFARAPRRRGARFATRTSPTTIDSTPAAPLSTPPAATAVSFPGPIAAVVTTPRPASPAVDGQLVVTTQPQGARVTVDGFGAGRHAPDDSAFALWGEVRPCDEGRIRERNPLRPTWPRPPLAADPHRAARATIAAILVWRDARLPRVSWSWTSVPPASRSTP